MGEHSGRKGYEYLGSVLAEEEYAVLALDHQGHGKSNGSRGYIRSFMDLVDDMEEFIRVSISKHENLRGIPIFLLGHSMGAALTLAFLLYKKPQNIKGVIITSPALGLHKVHQNTMGPGKRLAYYFPKVVISPPINPNLLSRKEQSCIEYANDRLVYHGWILASTGYQLCYLSQCLARDYDKIQHPLLLFHGTKDALCPSQYSEEFYRSNACQSDKEIHILENVFHEVWEDPERDVVLSTIKKWLKKHEHEHKL